MSRVKIFVDTCSDITDEIAEKYNIGIIRLLSIFDEKSYVTGTELSNGEFYKMLEESEGLPTTSQTPYADMYDILKSAAEEYDSVIYFAMSSKASGQYNSARMICGEIKEENPNADIHIVDTMRFSVYITAAAVYAAELTAAGESVESTIQKCMEMMEEWQAYILVDTLKYLEKGGRITKTSAIVGTLLDIKPVLTVNDGLIEPLEKIRGRKKLYKKLIELIRENPEFDDENPEFMIAQSSEEYGREMCELLKEEFGISDVKYYLEFGPVVGTHIGPGTLAVLFRHRKK